MFKSCFPNSALQGSLADPIPAISSNPLRSQSAGSSDHTVSNAKGIYIDLLEYFASKQDTLFVVITAPPLSDSTYASNARAFNQWLVNDWLKDYPYNNVYVFDFYNVLTSNGGSASTNDLGQTGGNHHRWWNGAVQHQVGVLSNTSAYPSGDDHPSQAGNLKATAEYLPLLNYAYNRWNLSSAIGVVRNNNTWLLDASGIGVYGAGDLAYTFGKAGDTYVTGDWDGDGTTEIGVVRNNNTWLLDASGKGAYGAGDLAYTFGKAGDTYVTGDWDGVGHTEIGVVRNNKTWLLDASGNGAYGAGDLANTFGKAGDVYVTGDWDGDGTTEIGEVRNNNTWLLDASGNGAYGAGDLAYTFGKAGDLFVTGVW
jgi:hypothetical protein